MNRKFFQVLNESAEMKTAYLMDSGNARGNKEDSLRRKRAKRNPSRVQ